VGFAGLILEPAPGSVEVNNCVTRHDAYNTSRDFLDCIRDSASLIIAAAAGTAASRASGARKLRGRRRLRWGAKLPRATHKGHFKEHVGIDCQAPRRQRTWGAHDGGAAPGDGWRAIAGHDWQQPASKSGSCVMPSQPVPELTGIPGIKLNQRVSLRDRARSIRSCHRTLPDVRVHHGAAAGRSYSGRQLRFERGDHAVV
jgi:hypothetical protein